MNKYGIMNIEIQDEYRSIGSQRTQSIVQCFQIHTPSLETEDGVAIALIPADTGTGVIITGDSIDRALLSFMSIDDVMLETAITSGKDKVVTETGIEAEEDADVHASPGFRIISTHDVFSWRSSSSSITVHIFNY